jgi:hypothetical protein
VIASVRKKKYTRYTAHCSNVPQFCLLIECGHAAAPKKGGSEFATELDHEWLEVKACARAIWHVHTTECAYVYVGVYG